MRYPLIAPRPPRLSGLGDALRAIEDAGVYSNGGPTVRGFEDDATRRLFGGTGACLAVTNATTGLMLAMREASRGREGGYALMPAFTFAAAAQAALWAGLTPLLCDSDPDDWAAAADAEEAAIATHGDRIAVVVPYDCFGTAIDLARYQAMADRHGTGVVVDAAASLGAIDADGRHFGTDARFAVVFSMHATKPFATAEGGLIHCADAERIETLRRMSNFGFGDARSAELPGLNAKLPEVLGLLASAQLTQIERVADHRARLSAAYRARLGDRVTFQKIYGRRPVAQFQPILLPPALAERRAEIEALLARADIGTGRYFSPHLGQQPWFRDRAVSLPTPVADDIAARILSLPITDAMEEGDVHAICDAVEAALDRVARAACPAPVPVAPMVHSTLMIGGGPAGVAVLISASKQGRLRELAASGLVVLERRDRLGGGELPDYAITSDTTAETFLSAVKDNPEPTIAALMEHPGAVEIARYIGALGVPLSRTGPFLEAMGARVADIVRDSGGQVLTQHYVRESRRTATGLWETRVRDAVSGAERVYLSRNIIVATGGYQARDQIAMERVAGIALGEELGERFVASDALLRIGGVDRLRERLGDVRAPRIAIVGASTSATAGAVLLLKSGIPFGAGALTILHREEIHPFYPSVEAAHADGFTDFGPDDICPLSGFVYRLAGFRLESRELVLRMLEIGGRVPDPRVRMHRLAGDDDAEAARILREADIVVGALGYRPVALPLYGPQGDRIALAAHAPGRPRLADQQCRILDANGDPLPGAYGIGLAAGFVPEGALGGEPSFRGKANGLWLWQNDVGQIIVDRLLEARARAAA